MKMQFRISELLICALLGCFIVDVASVRRTRKSTLNRRCKSPNGDMENGIYIEHNVGYRRREYRTYTCRPTYIMNVPQGLKYICKRYGRVYKWRAKGHPKLYLNAVTCTQKNNCEAPPISSKLARIDDIRYKLQNVLLIRNLNPQQKQQQRSFVTGDTVSYKCKESETSVRFVCDTDGLWNGLAQKGTNFDPCKETKCNASQFADIGHGHIVDYKDTYAYKEEMKLSCEPGYWPMNDRTSLTCMHWNSFRNEDIPRFGCEFNVAKKLESITQQMKNYTLTTLKQYRDKNPEMSKRDGLDVYLLVDVSHGILTTNKFPTIKKTIEIIISKLGIGRGPKDTRLALIIFTTGYWTVFHQHYNDPDHSFKSHKDASAEIGKLDEQKCEDIMETRSITDPMSEVLIDVQTKILMFQNGITTRDAKQIIILLSDGLNITSREITNGANELKRNLDTDIYSIFIGQTGNRIGLNRLNDLASDKPNKQHFLAINASADGPLLEVLKVCTIPDDAKFRFTNDEFEHDMKVGEMVFAGDTVRVKCRVTSNDDSSVTNDFITCLEDNMFTEVHLNCITPNATKCDAVISNGKILNKFLDEIEVICDTGYILNIADTNAKLTCKENKLTPETNGQTPECQPNGCVLPENMPDEMSVKIPGTNGIALSQMSVVRHGEIVIFDCPDGFEPKKRRYICDAEMWIPEEIPWILNTDGHLPQCKRVLCDAACTINGGECIAPGTCRCNNGRYGNNCDLLSCSPPETNALIKNVQPYYRGRDSPELICEETTQLNDTTPLICLTGSGEWSHGASCVPVTCPPPLTNAMITNLQEEYSGDDNPGLSCPVTMQLNNTSKMKCSPKDGTWSHNVSCISLIGTRCNSWKDCGGSKTMSCRSGECKCNAAFQLVDGICERVSCPSPTTNGTLTDQDVKNIYYQGDSVTITCPIGYMIFDYSKVTCWYGQWSHNVTCLTAIGIPCFSKNDCGSALYLMCSQGTCTCKPGNKNVNGKCQKVLGSACTADADCSMEGVFCFKGPDMHSGKCTCKQGTSCELSIYSGHIKTADKPNAGTSAAISINIIGNQGETGDFSIGNDLNTGSLKEFNEEQKYVGKIGRIKFSLSKNVLGDFWWPDWVILYNQIHMEFCVILNKYWIMIDNPVFFPLQDKDITYFDEGRRAKWLGDSKTYTKYGEPDWYYCMVRCAKTKRCQGSMSSHQQCHILYEINEEDIEDKSHDLAWETLIYHKVNNY